MPDKLKPGAALAEPSQKHIGTMSRIGVIAEAMQAPALRPAVTGLLRACDAGLRIGLAPTLWGWPVWVEE
jgi:hypothetical protein